MSHRDEYTPVFHFEIIVEITEIVSRSPGWGRMARVCSLGGCAVLGEQGGVTGSRPLTQGSGEVSARRLHPLQCEHL